MEDFYISAKLSVGQVQDLLQSAMPSLTVFPWEALVGSQEPMEFDSADSSHIFYEVSESEVPQFPQHLAIYRTSSEQEEARALWLGQQMSAAYGVRVLVPFTYPDKPEAPFYNIVFQDGLSYLADDSETEFGEPDAKPVRILEPYTLPKVEFDAFGRYVNV